MPGQPHGRLGSGSGRRVSTPGAWADVQPLAETVPSLAVRRAVPLKGCRARLWREHYPLGRWCSPPAAALLTEVGIEGG
jgi:hypothetical protein